MSTLANRARVTITVLLSVIVVGCGGTSTVPPPTASPSTAPPTTASAAPGGLMESAANLRTIIKGAQDHHDVFMTFPANIKDASGKPLLSWRVKLLPQIGGGELFKKFNTREPWDSEQNKKLIAEMPKAYVPTRGTAKPGETFYQGFVGKGTMFDPAGPAGIFDIKDGTSSTIFAVESSTPVVWTKPEDLPLDAAQELPKLGALLGEEFPAAPVDGDVQTVKKDYDAAEFKKMVTRNGLEPVDLEKVFKKK